MKKKILFVLPILTSGLLLSACGLSSNTEENKEFVNNVSTENNDVKEVEKDENVILKDIVNEKDNFKISNNQKFIAIVDNDNQLHIYDIEKKDMIENIAKSVSTYQWFEDALYFLSNEKEYKYNIGDYESSIDLNTLFKYDLDTKEIAELYKPEIQHEHNAFVEAWDFDIQDKDNVLLTLRIGWFESEYYLDVFHTDLTFENLNNITSNNNVFSNIKWSNNKVVFVGDNDIYSQEPKLFIYNLKELETLNNININDLLPIEENSYPSVETILTNKSSDKFFLEVVYPEYIYEEERLSFDNKKLFILNLENNKLSEIEIDFTKLEVYDDILIYESTKDNKHKIILNNNGDIKEIDGFGFELYEGKLLYISNDTYELEEEILSSE